MNILSLQWVVMCRVQPKSQNRHHGISGQIGDLELLSNTSISRQQQIVDQFRLIAGKRKRGYINRTPTGMRKRDDQRRVGI